MLRLRKKVKYDITVYGAKWSHCSDLKQRNLGRENELILREENFRQNLS